MLTFVLTFSVKRQILHYKTALGKDPVAEFLDALSAKAAQKVVWVLLLLEEMAILPSKYFTKLTDTDDIWEAKISFGSNIYRVFFFFYEGNVVVLTHGIIKKTQKTPSGEIDKAEKYKKDYEGRHKK